MTLLLTVALVALVVATGARSSDPTSSALSAATTATTAAPAPGRRTYVVRRGDDLSSIAVRFEVSLKSLMDLNPRVDPQSVNIGTRLKLR